MIVWTIDDLDVSRREGWYLSTTPQLCVRAVYGPVNGEQDRRMQAFVARRADEGSPLHQKALAFIAQQRLLT